MPRGARAAPRGRHRPRRAVRRPGCRPASWCALATGTRTSRPPCRMSVGARRSASDARRPKQATASACQPVVHGGARYIAKKSPPADATSAWSGSDFTVRRRPRRADRQEAPRVPGPARARVRAWHPRRCFARRPPIRLAIALTGFLNSLIRRWVREPRLDLLREGEALLDIFFHGTAGSGRASRRGGATR